MLQIHVEDGFCPSCGFSYSTVTCVLESFQPLVCQAAEISFLCKLEIEILFKNKTCITFFLTQRDFKCKQ